MLNIASSSWLRLISTPLPLTITVSGKSSPSLVAGFAAATADDSAAGASSTGRAANNGRPSKTIVFFINIGGEYNTESEFDHINISNVGILLQFIQHVSRRHAIEI